MWKRLRKAYEEQHSSAVYAASLWETKLAPVNAMRPAMSHVQKQSWQLTSPATQIGLCGSEFKTAHVRKSAYIQETAR